MLDEDATLNASVIYSEEYVLAEFQGACEAEGESPGQHRERVSRAAADLCQTQERNKSPSDP
jgi:hypothetical protein